jgi:3-carboxy-cis,cis-muconate cycloisomerase
MSGDHGDDYGDDYAGGTPDPLAGTGLYGELFSDPDTAAMLTEQAEVEALIAVEAALARVQGRLGVIPADAAMRIDGILTTLEIDPASLAAGTASAGVPIPALVDAIRAAVGPEAAPWVHWGATSQDIVDTGLVVRLRPLLDVLDARLGWLSERLAGIAREHAGTVLAARTRSQQATPTTFGLKVANWAAPLGRHRTRLAQLRPRLLVVQLGGASGTLAALGEQGIEVMEGLADELGLGAPPGPWHTQRDAIAEVAGWLGLVCGTLGKMGMDLARLAQSEVAEAKPGAGGGSSTMPQKANPVRAEALVTLARLAAHLVGAVHDAQLQEHERDGAGWSLEWLTLPRLALAAGAALGQAEAIAADLTVDTARMAANLEASNGLLLAEAASFALAEHMPRPEAQALVKSACASVTAERRHLMEVLAEATDAPVDWERLRDPARSVGVAAELVERLLEASSGHRTRPDSAQH